MSEFKLAITELGRELLAKCQQGQTMVYTRIGLGEGVWADEADSVSDLVDIKLSLPLDKCILEGEKVVIGAQVSVVNLNEGFYFRELGIFAQDPSLGEILYAYGMAEVADWIDHNSLSERYIEIISQVNNVNEISAIIDSTLFATLEQLNEKVDKIHGKSLSTNDYTDADKDKLYSIEAYANNYVHPQNHAADVIIQDSNHRFVSDNQIDKWDAIEPGVKSYEKDTEEEAIQASIEDPYNEYYTTE